MARINPLLVPVILMAGSTAACGQGPATAASTAGTDTAAAAVPAPAAETVEVLPLQRGYYVRSDTPCDRASRADVFALVTRTGMNLNCRFKTIEKTGATTYRVTDECSDGGAAWGREEEVVTATATYEIPDETRYTVTHEDGYEASARHCAQSAMSADYRDNDIDDLIR